MKEGIGIGKRKIREKKQRRKIIMGKKKMKKKLEKKGKKSWGKAIHTE